MDEAVIGIAGALAGGAITAVVNSWLAARARIAEELRGQRLDPYRDIWVQTALFSRWPWTDATYGRVRSFHVDLRQWYYADGGMLMSENTRARYGHVQEVAEALVELGRPDDDVLDAALPAADAGVQRTSHGADRGPRVAPAALAAADARARVAARPPASARAAAPAGVARRPEGHARLPLSPRPLAALP